MAEIVAVVGVVASVASIADEGLKIYGYLNTYIDKIRNADRDIAGFANDVRDTSVVLQQLGGSLDLEKETRICRPEFYHSLSENIEDCARIFSEIDSTLAQSADVVGSEIGKPKIYSMKGRDKFRWPFKHSKVTLLRSDLDRLKKNLHLMITVMSHAREVQVMKEEKRITDKEKDIVEREKESKHRDKMIEFQIEQLKIETLELETRQAERKFQALKREASKARYDWDDLDDDHRDLLKEPPLQTTRMTRSPSFRPASPKTVTISQPSEKRKVLGLDNLQNGTTYTKPAVQSTTSKEQLTKSSLSHRTSARQESRAPDYPMMREIRGNEMKSSGSLVTGRLATDGDDLPLDWVKLGSFLSRIADAQEVLARPRDEKSMPSLPKTPVSEGPSGTQSQSDPTALQDSYLLTKGTDQMANNIGKAEIEGSLPMSATLRVPTRTLRKSPKSRTISEESAKDYIKQEKVLVKEESQADKQSDHRRDIVNGANATPSDSAIAYGNPNQAGPKATSIERSLVPYHPWLLHTLGNTLLYAKSEPSPPPTPYKTSYAELPQVYGPGPRHPHSIGNSDKGSESLPQSQSKSNRSNVGSQDSVGNSPKISNIPQVPQLTRSPYRYQSASDSVEDVGFRPKDKLYTHLDNDGIVRPRYEAYEYSWPDNLSEQKLTRVTAVESWIPVSQEELIRRVEETNTKSIMVADRAEGLGTFRKLLNKVQSREQEVKSVLEQYESMESFRKAYVLGLLERKNKDEKDSSFRWLLASIKFEKQPNDRRSRLDIKSMQIIIMRTFQSAFSQEPISCVINMTGLRDSINNNQTFNKSINDASAENASNHQSEKAAVRIDGDEQRISGQKARRSDASSDDPRKQTTNEPRLPHGQMSPVRAPALQEPAHVQHHLGPTKSQDPLNMTLSPPDQRAASSATNISLLINPDEPAVHFKEPRKVREINLDKRPKKLRDRIAFKDSDFDRRNINVPGPANATQPVPSTRSAQVNQNSGTSQPAHVPRDFWQPTAKPPIASHLTSLHPNAPTLPSFSYPEVRHPIASEPMLPHSQDFAGRVNDLRYASTYNMRAGPHSHQNILRTSEAWLLRRAEPDSLNAPRTWERVTRILLPMSTEELNDTIKRQAKSKTSLWETFSSLSTFQQRQIDALFEAKWAGESDNRLDWVLASLSIRPKKAKALEITSIQVVLKRSLQEGLPPNSMQNGYLPHGQGYQTSAPLGMYHPSHVETFGSGPQMPARQGMPVQSFPPPPPPDMPLQPFNMPYRSETHHDAHRQTGRSARNTGQSKTDSAYVKSDQQSSSRRPRVHRRRALSSVDDYMAPIFSDSDTDSDGNTNLRQADLGPRTSLRGPDTRRRPDPADLRVANMNRKSTIWEGDTDDYTVTPTRGPSKSRDTRSLGIISARHLEQDLQETENKRLAIEKELSRRYGYNPRRDNMKEKEPEHNRTRPSSTPRRQRHDNWPFEGEEYPDTRSGNQRDGALGSSGQSQDLPALSGLYYGRNGGPLRNTQVPLYAFTLPKPNPIVDNILSKWTTVSADIQEPQKPVDNPDSITSTTQKNYIVGDNPESSKHVPPSTQNKYDEVTRGSDMEEKPGQRVRRGKEINIHLE